MVSDDSLPMVSVIVPVFRDSARATLAVKALRAQSYPAERLEILLVDNDPTPDLVLKSFAADQLRVVHAPEGFSYAARNAGARLAQGTLLAFTDADCIPEPDWIEMGVRRLVLDGRDLLGGEIDVFCERITWSALYDRAFGLHQKDFFERFGGMATANLFVRKQTWEDLAGFDARLQSGGDFEFCRRARSAGASLGYSAHARVRHPARDSWSQLCGKVRRVGGGIADTEFRQCQSARTQPNFWRGFVKPQFRDWWRTLAGGNGAEELPLWRRPILLIMRVFLQYRLALAIDDAVTNRARVKTTL
jgi:glycosyltransferase involved in cell wall biosynthesis